MPGVASEYLRMRCPVFVICDGNSTKSRGVLVPESVAYAGGQKGRAAYDQIHGIRLLLIPE